MKFYLDSEFDEDGRTIELISIGIVSETGQEFYRQSAEFHPGKCNEWVQANVLPKLRPCPKGIVGQRHVYGLCTDTTCVWRPRRMIRDELFNWVGLLSKPDGMTWQKPEFWGYFADYDWVLLCQLFGRMIDLPNGWPMYCRDLKQYVDSLGGFDLPPEGKDEHNALSDARWIKAAHEYATEVEEEVNARRKKARAVDKEREAVRSAEGQGHAEVPGGGDLQRELQQGEVVGPEEGEEALGAVTIDQKGVSYAGFC